MRTSYRAGDSCPFPKTILRFLQPFILARFVRYFVPCSNMSLIEVVLWAVLNSLVPFLMLITRQMAYTRAFIDGMHLRCAYNGLIFRKV